jgi:hypothetical protein
MQHPLYGEIPLLRHESHLGGKTYEYWQPDPAYQPRLPRGAVAGDVTKQVFCPCHTPRYFYVDETRTCIQCGECFPFSAGEQKYWYEVRQFNFHSQPIRCPRCRRLRRSEHALREQIAAARRAVRDSPAAAAAHQALARAIVEYHERTNAGSLEDAIAAARKALGLRPDVAESLVWLGIAHLRAGRSRKGLECLARFVERSGGQDTLLDAKVRRYLDEGST